MMPLIPRSSAAFHAKRGGSRAAPLADSAEGVAYFFGLHFWTDWEPLVEPSENRVTAELSDIPAASRTSSRVMYSRPRAIFPSGPHDRDDLVLSGGDLLEGLEPRSSTAPSTDR